MKKRNYFAEYGELARKVLETLLNKYADEGILAIDESIDRKKIVDFLKVPPFDKIGSPVQVIREFGGKENYLKAIKELEEQIYQSA